MLVLAAVSLGLMAWSHLGWYELQQRAQILAAQHVPGPAQALAAELHDAIGQQQRLDLLKMALVGSLTVLLLVLIARVQRQREDVVGSLKAREHQLRHKSRM